MWKFQDFSVIQILREINFGESRSTKTAVFAISGSLYFDNLLNICLQKVKKFTLENVKRSQKFKIQSCSNGENGSS